MWFGSHFTAGVTRRLLLSFRVSLLVMNLLTIRERVRACLHGGWGHQVGEVSRLGGVKHNPPLHAILQARHPGEHFLKIIEWSLSS